MLTLFYFFCAVLLFAQWTVFPKYPTLVKTIMYSQLLQLSQYDNESKYCDLEPTCVIQNLDTSCAWFFYQPFL